MLELPWKLVSSSRAAGLSQVCSIEEQLQSDAVSFVGPFSSLQIHVETMDSLSSGARNKPVPGIAAEQTRAEYADRRLVSNRVRVDRWNHLPWDIQQGMT